MKVAVSVVIACYRCADTIERAVGSIACQSQVPSEVILVDDYSNDGTLQCLYSLQRRYAPGWIVVLSQPSNQGPGSARNVGWGAASQPYIAFLDADDRWHPQKVELQYQLMSRSTEMVLSGHLTRLASVGDATVGYSFAEISTRRFGRFSMLVKNRLPTRSVMLKRDLPFRFQDGKRASEDYLLWLTIVLAGHVATRIELPLAFSYKADYGAGGLTADLWKMQKGNYDTYVRVCRNGLVSPLEAIFWLTWSMAKFVRRWLIVKWRLTSLSGARQ